MLHHDSPYTVLEQNHVVVGNTKTESPSRSKANRKRKHSKSPGSKTQSGICGISVRAANSGDHPTIYAFLKTNGKGPNELEFEHTLDHPNYIPSQRLLAYRDGELIGHLRLKTCVLLFRGSQLPSAELCDFVILPEFANSGCREALLQAAEKEAGKLGLILLTSRSTPSAIANDWCRMRTDDDISISPPDLLSAMETWFLRNPQSQIEMKRYDVRPLRWVQRDQIAQLYSEATNECQGSVKRDHEQWNWLAGRRGYDRALVCVDTSSESEEVVGYAFVRGNSILEAVVSKHHSPALFRLLRRLSLDAFERGAHSLLFCGGCTVGNERFRQLLRTSGAINTPSALFCKAVSHEKLIKKLSINIATNARSVGLATGSQLAIECAGKEFLVQLQRHKIRFTRKETSPSKLRLAKSQLTALVLGGVNAVQAVRQGTIASSDQIAPGIASKLFAQKRLLKMAFDDVTAIA